MRNNKSIIFAQFSSGVFTGTIFGLVGFSLLLNYGSNHGGCWHIVDNIFGTAGYESCGLLGAILGITSGAILGSIAILILSKHYSVNYFKIAIYSLLGTFILPLLLTIILSRPYFGWDQFSMFLMIGMPIIAYSILLSLLIISIIYLLKFLTK